MSTPTKVVLFGLGRMGSNHLRVLRETPGFDLVAVVDSHVRRPDLQVPLLNSIDDLGGISFDAAVIATPTVTHHDLALALIRRGKHVLIEKPIASTFAQGRELLAAANLTGAKLAVGHVERFNPAVRKLREIIREGWLGTPIHFSFTRVGGYPETELAGNNVIVDLAVHDIDVLRSIVGPVRLEHSMCHVTWRPGVFDTAEILLGSRGGASATVHVNWVTPTKIRTIRVTGTRGVCFVDYMLQTCELYGGSLLKPKEPGNTSFEHLQEVYRTTDRIQFGVRKEEPLRAQAVQFRRLLTEGESGELSTASDALAAVLVAERAMQTDRSRSVSAPPRPQSASAPPEPSALPSFDDEWI